MPPLCNKLTTTLLTSASWSGKSRSWRRPRWLPRWRTRGWGSCAASTQVHFRTKEVADIKLLLNGNNNGDYQDKQQEWGGNWRKRWTRMKNLTWKCSFELLNLMKNCSDPYYLPKRSVVCRIRRRCSQVSNRPVVKRNSALIKIIKHKKFLWGFISHGSLSASLW